MKKLLSISLCLCISSTAFCQQANPDNFAKMVDFLPPPPNAAAIAKAGLMNLNKNTGAPSISIPLYSIKGRKLATEVSLSYSTNGIKVDEIASRVGMGWAINSGGVITRTVRGLSDEDHVRTWPWASIGYNWATYNFLRKVAAPLAAPNGQEYDGEPDLFNFNVNGISGSFVFDENMNIVLVPHNNVVIEKNFGGTAWNFKITGPDGIKYYFGGTNATEKTKRLTSCGKTFGYYIPTAWYLTKIEHPNGEVITFNYTPHTYSYDTGISENWSATMGFWGGGGYGCGATPPGASNAPTSGMSPCKNYVNTQGVLLNNIVTDNYAKIQFNYTTRLDDSQDKLITSVVETDLNTNATISSFNFNYTNFDTHPYTSYQGGAGSKVPYLTSLTETSGDNQLSKTHYFTYDDPVKRPSRLTYAQDHWGFFNGKDNAMLVPKVSSLSAQFPNLSANRDPDFEFTSKGMLKKIVYPTGGIQTLEYEPNIERVQSNYSPLHQHTCSVSSTGITTPNTKEFNFSVDHVNEVVNLTFSVLCNDPSTCDPNHLFGTVTIVDAVGNTVNTYTTPAGASFTHLQWYLVNAGNFKLILTASGNVTTGVTMEYHPVLTGTPMIDKVVGGLRVKAIITGNPNEKPMVKKYYYGDINNLNVSSLSPVPDPEYVKYYNLWNIQNMTGEGYFVTCVWSRPMVAVYANSITNLFDYSNTITSYASVVEGIGENFEGGATQSKFISVPDGGGAVLIGSPMYDAPKINTSLALNGKPTEETVFKNVGGNLQPVSKQAYTYNVTNVHEVPGYVVNQFRGWPIQFDTTQVSGWLPDLVESFDLMKYSVFAPWTVTQTVTETQYDENGANPLTKTTTNQYANNVHLQLTSSSTTNSKNETITNTFKYPWDFEGIDPGADQLLLQHNITALIESKSMNGNSETERVFNHYSNFGNNNVEVQSIDKSVKGNTLESLGTISKRDNYGNILEFTGKDGVTNSIIWGYKYTYPVAKIVNSGYDAAVALLGISVADLQNLDGTALQTKLNLVRTGLPGSQVTSYTYTPLVGVTSITDPNNKTNTYQYDAFSRLVVIKDQDNNVVKKMDYQYNGGNPSSTFTIYFNDPQTLGFACQHCQSGYTTSAIPYSVAAGRFYSLESKDDANAKALAYLNATGPAYVEEYSRTNPSCFNSYCAAPAPACTTSNCNAVNKKCINGVCEPGRKVYTSSVYNRFTQTWTCTYHYAWSDGSVSPDYTETSPATCTPEA